MNALMQRYSNKSHIKVYKSRFWQQKINNQIHFERKPDAVEQNSLHSAFPHSGFTKMAPVKLLAHFTVRRPKQFQSENFHQKRQLNFLC